MNAWWKPRISTSLVAALLLAIGMIAASVALGVSPRTGHWSGTTAQGKSIKLKVGDDGEHVTSLKFKVEARCSTGSLRAKITFPYSTDISSSGRFNYSGQSALSSAHVEGKFLSAHRAKGKLRYKTIHAVGGVCRSGVVKWRANKG